MTNNDRAHGWKLSGVWIFLGICSLGMWFAFSNWAMRAFEVVAR